ncbi:MAG: hypothetical protein WKG07_35105 [Hymenobacter sp.]
MYHNEFRDAAGEVVESRAGAQDLFYIQGDNYKLCNGKKETRELYVGKTRTLQMLQSGRVVTVPDTARHQIQVVATQLPTTAVVLGRPCQAVQVGARCHHQHHLLLARGAGPAPGVSHEPLWVLVRPAAGHQRSPHPAHHQRLLRKRLHGHQRSHGH